jgi:VanZ family protein
MKSIPQISLCIYTLFILVLSLIPINPAVTPLNDTFVLSIRLDYLFHFAIFIPLMFLIWIAFGINFRKNFRYALTWIVMGLLYSWFTEGIQYFIPYRSFNTNDLLANSTGILLGSLFFMIPRSPKLQRKIT